MILVFILVVVLPRRGREVAGVTDNKQARAELGAFLRARRAGVHAAAARLRRAPGWPPEPGVDDVRRSPPGSGNTALGASRQGRAEPVPDRCQPAARRPTVRRAGSALTDASPQFRAWWAE